MSRVTTMLNRARAKNPRQALWEKRNNNPPNHIGYVDLNTREIYTARGRVSDNMRPAMDGRSFVEGNNIHDRRVTASVSPDFTCYVKR